MINAVNFDFLVIMKLKHYMNELMTIHSPVCIELAGIIASANTLISHNALSNDASLKYR